MGGDEENHEKRHITFIWALLLSKPEIANTQQDFDEIDDIWSVGKWLRQGGTQKHAMGEMQLFTAQVSDRYT